MNKALLIIDVHNDYLKQHAGVVDIHYFLQGIVKRVRVAEQNGELVLFFTDFHSAKFPDEFSELLRQHGPAMYKVEYTAFDYDPPEESEIYEILQEHGIE